MQIYRNALLLISLLGGAVVLAEEPSITDRVKAVFTEQIAKAYLKLDDLKEHGPSGSDLLDASAFTVGMYVLYKTACLFRAGDTRKASLAGIGLMAGCYLLWKYKSKESDSSEQHEAFINQFLATLNSEQHAKIGASESLTLVVQEALQDPLYLITPEFMDLLDAKQQLELEQALDNHILAQGGNHE